MLYVRNDNVMIMIILAINYILMLTVSDFISFIHKQLIYITYILTVFFLNVSLS